MFVFRSRCALLARRGGDEAIDSGQESALLIGGQGFDLLHAPDELEAGLLARGDAGGAGLEKFVGGDIESLGEADGHLCGEAELAAFVGRDERLNEADAFGELGLG